MLLKTLYAEFSSSIFSTPIKIENLIFYGGNRDFSWQGLIIGPINNILYKLIDGVYYSIGEPLKAEKVLFKLGECVYIYKNGENKLFSVKISLKSLKDCVILESSASEPCWFTVLLDFRPGEKWIDGKYSINFLKNEAIIENSIVPLKLVINEFDKAYPLNLILNWRYKLGDGFRQIKNNDIVFIEHYRPVYLPAIFHSSLGSLKMKIPLFNFVNYVKTDWNNRVLKLDFGNSYVGKAIKLRLETLFSYGLIINNVWFPEAGAWWFRRGWVRDAIEGLRWNIKTYIKIFNWIDKVNFLIQYLLNTLKSLLGLPIIINERSGFSSDAPPQLLNVACDLALFLKNKSLLLKVVEAASFIAEKFIKGLSVSKTILKDSILCSPSNSSWIDSVVTVNGKLWPSRIPMEWIDKDINPFESEFGLVEVNALYIEALKKINDACEKFNVKKSKIINELLKILLEGFTKYFKKGSFLPALTIAPSYNLLDYSISSPSLIASSILIDKIYNIKELNQIWNITLDKLLVYRKLIALGDDWHPFGVLVKSVERKPYLNDFEYHKAVTWPRDTPYLINLLEKLNMDFKGVLLNNLDHMLVEGAFGYCNELFSLPIGKNSSPTFESKNPIPVKNPAQYWSHWCDPYINHLNKLI